jgi:nicotinate-nucleotide adenylyltransferase
VHRGVFGGSFDPPHVGHVGVAAAASAALDLDVVHLIPTYQQPFKHESHGANGEQRAEMVRLAIADSERLIVDQREIRRGGTSYTVDTLEELRRVFPADELTLLVGADTAVDMPSWYRAERLPELANIVVLTRPGAKIPSHPMFQRSVNVPAFDVSATEIRERAGRGESLAGLVAEPVEAYIVANRLYQQETK